MLRGIAFRGGNGAHIIHKVFQFAGAQGYRRHSTLSHAGRGMLQSLGQKCGREDFAGARKRLGRRRTSGTIVPMTGGASVCFKNRLPLGFRDRRPRCRTWSRFGRRE